MVLPYKVYKIARFEGFVDTEYVPKRVTFTFPPNTRIFKSKEIFDLICKPYMKRSARGKEEAMIRNFEIETDVDNPYVSLKDMINFIGTYWNRYAEKELTLNGKILDKEHNNTFKEISKLIKTIHSLGYNQGKDDVLEKLDVKGRLVTGEHMKAVRGFIETVKNVNYSYDF